MNGGLPLPGSLPRPPAGGQSITATAQHPHRSAVKKTRCDAAGQRTTPYQASAGEPHISSFNTAQPPHRLPTEEPPARPRRWNRLLGVATTLVNPRAILAVTLLLVFALLREVAGTEVAIAGGLAASVATLGAIMVLASAWLILRAARARGFSLVDLLDGTPERTALHAGSSPPRLS